MHLPTDNIEINRANPNKWLFMLLSYKSVTTKKNIDINKSQSRSLPEWTILLLCGGFEAFS